MDQESGLPELRAHTDSLELGLPYHPGDLEDVRLKC